MDSRGGRLWRNNLVKFIPALSYKPFTFSKLHFLLGAVVLETIVAYEGLNCYGKTVLTRLHVRLGIFIGVMVED